MKQSRWQRDCFVVLLLAMTILVMWGCAKKPPAKPVPRPKKPPVVEPVPAIPQALNPRREASLKIVSAGNAYLEQGEIDKAMRAFEEAINIDSDNGVAFYFLAKTLYKKQSYDEALGILERAQVLLASNPEWAGEVARLKETIETAVLSGPEPPGDNEVIYY